MRKALIFLIKSYKYCLSPFLPSGCRFAPSCSQYTIDAISKYGPLKGTYLSIIRILKCHPFHPGGYDPVK